MEAVRDYELKAFFAYVVSVLERLNIPYMVVGGFAAILHGEPRLTLDVDILVDMHRQHVPPFVEAFPIPEYYVSEEGIRDSLRQRYPFNVIQPTTGAKVDLVPLPHDSFTLASFQRRQRLQYDEEGRSAVFITPEDIVLAKLIAFRETGSDKHLRDARGVLVVQADDLDLKAIRQRVGASGLEKEFDAIVEAIRAEGMAELEV